MPETYDPAPPSRIARAARAYGDHFPVARRQLDIRAVGALMVVLGAFYLRWLFAHLDTTHLWLAGIFGGASLLSALCLLVSVINGWWSEVTPRRVLEGPDVPEVAILIPTCGEPVAMVLRTIASVLDQDYPRERLRVVVSDDAHDPLLRRAVHQMGVTYHEPPARWAPGRDGAPKSGNLNSALELVRARWPQVAFVETRDSDDELGSRMFLRHVMGQLAADPRLAYVQTVKEAQVSAGDPFCNLDGQFYRGQMITKNAANAVFPCGSGLVWRKAALEDIGGFPTWNLVEDLQSGVEALRRGWRGCYLMIVGAVGQHAPEDVPNVYKQRGTWAIDTVRLVLWRRMRGMTLRQRLHFYEMLLFYVQSFTVPAWIITGSCACFGLLPLRANPLAFLLHLAPYALVIEWRLLILNRPFADRRRKQRHPIRALWRMKVMWLGLSPVYMLSCAKAVVGGPHRRPVYKITRKHTQPGFYWRETAPQALLGLVLPASFIAGAITGRLPSLPIMIASEYWAIMCVAALFGMVHRGFRGAAVAGLRTDTRLSGARTGTVVLRSPPQWADVPGAAHALSRPVGARACRGPAPREPPRLGLVPRG